MFCPFGLGLRVKANDVYAVRHAASKAAVFLARIHRPAEFVFVNVVSIAGATLQSRQLGMDRVGDFGLLRRAAQLVADLSAATVRRHDKIKRGVGQ